MGRSSGIVVIRGGRRRRVFCPFPVLVRVCICIIYVSIAIFVVRIVLGDKNQFLQTIIRMINSGRGGLNESVADPKIDTTSHRHSTPPANGTAMAEAKLEISRLLTYLQRLCVLKLTTVMDWISLRLNSGGISVGVVLILILIGRTAHGR